MAKPPDHRSFIWVIDDADKIVSVNDEWLAFAQENGAPQLTAAAVLNQSLWPFIQGMETAYLYKKIFDRVRTGVSPVGFPFRCDSPDCRRFMKMTLSLLGGQAIQFKSQIVREEWRTPVDLLDQSRERSGELLRICSWCKLVYIPGQGWGEIEEAVRALDLFGKPSVPETTHTICPNCHEAINLELNLELGDLPDSK